MATVSAEYPVVSDKLRYGLKPIAIESKCHIIQCPALETNLYEGTTASSIVIRILVDTIPADDSLILRHVNSRCNSF